MAIERASLSLFLVLSLFAFFQAGLCEIVFSNVERTIDISNQLSRNKISVNVANTGSTPVSSFKFELPSAEENLAIITFSENQKELPASRSVKNGNIIFDVQINLKAQSSSLVQIIYVLVGKFRPLPEKVTQQDKQYVVYQDYHFLVSDYVVEKQLTRVKLGTTRVESYTELSPSVQLSDEIRLGPYASTAPRTVSVFEVHYEHNNHLTRGTVRRDLEVSHWGNVAVEEHYFFENAGAKFTGPFSRLDFQRFGAPAVLRSFNEIIPSQASGIYYRDEIGNISTSRIQNQQDVILLELEPRFPLLGGWSIDFYMGYNLPTRDYLSTSNSDSSSFQLNISFAPLFREPLYFKELTVRVILPEGSTDIDVKTPFPIERGEGKLLTYLDTTGRPVVTLKINNAVNLHHQYFQVLYSFPSYKMFIEPALLIVFFFAIFLVSGLLLRLNLSISK